MTKNHPQEPKGIKLSGVQLCTLGHLLDYSHLLLPQDPLRGLLVEEIAETLFQSQQDLIEQGILLDRNGEVSLSPELVPVLKALCEPQASLLVNHSSTDTADSVLYAHRTGLLWVCVSMQGQDEYLLEQYSQENISSLLVSFLGIDRGINHTLSMDVEPIYLQQGMLAEARRIAVKKGVEAACTTLKKNGLNRGDVDMLLPVFASSLSSSSMLAIRWEGRTCVTVDSFACLNTGAGIWKIEPARDMPGWEVITSSSLEDLTSMVSSLVRKVMN